MKKIILLILLFVFTCVADCNAFWVWSSKTGKWVNPAYRIFETSQQQFDWAKQYFDDGEYKRAYSEFRKLVKKFPKSELAPDAKYFMGLSQERRRQHYKAFLTYQAVIETYPLNDRLEEIVERQYLIGEVFFKRRKYDRAKQIFEQSLSNAPYSKVADVVQYKVGLCSLRMREFVYARDDFDKVVENHAFSPYLDDASYYAALCSFKLSSLIKDYDTEHIDRAYDDLEIFLKRFPTSDYVKKAESLLNKLLNKKAEGLYIVAQFYEKQRKEYAAVKYYEQVVYNFDKTPWAKLAKPKLEKLRAKQ